MKLAEHLPQDEIAMFALAELDPETAAYAAVHLRHCDQCRGELATLQGDLVLYGLPETPLVSPPGESRARLLQAVARESRFAPQAAAPTPSVLQTEPVPLPERRNEPVFVETEARGRGLAWVGWALAACLAALAGWQFLETQDLRKQVTLEAAILNNPQLPAADDVVRAREIVRTLTDPAALQVALREPGRNNEVRPSAHVAYSQQTGDLLFVASHLHPLRSGRAYELWLLPASGANPVPAGVFHPDSNGNATVVLPDLPRDVAARGFGVTSEPDGGSAIPTLPIVLAGTAG